MISEALKVQILSWGLYQAIQGCMEIQHGSVADTLSSRVFFQAYHSNLEGVPWGTKFSVQGYSTKKIVSDFESTSIDPVLQDSHCRGSQLWNPRR